MKNAEPPKTLSANLILKEEHGLFDSVKNKLMMPTLLTFQ